MARGRLITLFSSSVLNGVSVFAAKVEGGVYVDKKVGSEF